MREIRKLVPGDLEAVARLFEVIAKDDSAEKFHPHPFTREHAESVVSHPGQDLYVGAFDDRNMIAYGLLRGWDEGYEIPSLGIYIVPDARGTGLSTEFMRRLHAMAAAQGAAKIMLKVYPDNVRARKLYESLGYRFESESEGQLVGFLDLESP